MNRNLPEVLLAAAMDIKESAECLKQSSALSNGIFPHFEDEQEYRRQILLVNDLVNHYLIHFKSSPDAEIVTFTCPACEEEYRLPEDTEVCPICHSMEISSV